MACFFVPTRHRYSRRYDGEYVADQWREAGGAYKHACEKGLAHGCFGFARLIAKSGNGPRAEPIVREFLAKALELNEDHIAAIELLRRLEAVELPDRPLG